MKIRLPLAFVAPLMACVALLGCGDDDTVSPPTTGAVQGTVTDVASGAPAADATVALFDPARLAPAGEPVLVSATGTYRIEDVMPGTMGLAIPASPCRR